MPAASDPEQREGHRLAAPQTGVARELQQADRLLLGLVQVALPQRQDRGAPQRVDEAFGFGVTAERQHLGEQATAFGPVPARHPVRPDRSRQPKRSVGVRARQQMVERGAEVRVLGGEPVEPLASVPCVQLRAGALAERHVPGGVTVPERARVRELVEPFDRELADRLEHPVAVVAAAQEALVDQRRDLVEIGAADLLGGLQRAPAGEHGEAGEQRCSAGVSRSWLQAIVARKVRCRSGADREPPASRGSRCSSRSSSIGSDSAFTRAAASSIASGRQSRRRQISATSPLAATSARTAAARCDEQLHRLPLAQRVDGDLPLAADVQRLTARHEHRQPRAAPIVSATPAAAASRCSKLSSTSSSRLSPTVAARVSFEPSA